MYDFPLINSKLSETTLLVGVKPKEEKPRKQEIVSNTKKMSEELKVSTENDYFT